MRSFEFDVLFWEDGQVQLNDLGIRPNVEETGTRPITFYSIDNIAPYFENEKEFCSIRSGGTEYIINNTYENVKDIIERSL